MSDTKTAEAIAALRQLLADMDEWSWMGGQRVRERIGAILAGLEGSEG